jgi:hypothetical protein
LFFRIPAIIWTIIVRIDVKFLVMRIIAVRKLYFIWFFVIILNFLFFLIKVLISIFWIGVAWSRGARRIFSDRVEIGIKLDVEQECRSANGVDFTYIDRASTWVRFTGNIEFKVVYIVAEFSTIIVIVDKKGLFTRIETINVEI